MSIRKFAISLLAATLCLASIGAGLASIGARSESSSADKLWQATYDARQKYFERTVGPLPSDISKMLNMTGVWPGGGLYVIPARALGQWAVNAEIGNDVGLLARVEKYDGLTVEQIQVGPDQMVSVLIAKALPPLPTGTDLPDARMDVLVATTITNQEMEWSQRNGRAALLGRLKEAGIGQISIPNRAGVVQ